MSSISWSLHRRAAHGIILKKVFGGHTRITTIPDKPGSMLKCTLLAILGPKQTDIGIAGLMKLIDKY
jgi:hypothetical protein